MLIPKAEARIDQYLSFLEKNAYRKIASLEFEIFETDKTFRSPPTNVSWRKIESPGPWGAAWHCAWFRTSYHTPKKSKGPLFLSVLPNADSLAFIDGKPYGAFNLFHKKLRIDADGMEHTLHAEAYAGHPYNGCGPLEGESIILTLGKKIAAYPNTFDGGCLLERLEPVYSLYYDVRVLYDLAKQLDNNSLRKARIIQGLYDALMGIGLTLSGEQLEAEAAKAAKSIAPLLASKNSDTVPMVHLVGHAHIDHAWLWHIGETERKAARTFSNMIRFMQEYPEFIFIQSQPCQLEIVKNEYPDIFDEIKKAYAKGGWEPNGGMWVEADCNIPSGESLVRQFLVGKAFNKEVFNYEADTLWLPDVFGYAAALPQILKGCGIKYFVTSKINWNDTTRFPYDTFIWRGIDGTGIKTHFITSRMNGYNGHVNPADLADSWDNVQHKEIQSAVVKSIGEGDGGGGTMRSDLESARRLNNLEGAPRAAWKKVSAALDEIFGSKTTEWPEWRGELYLELHRGTYTTQARTKQNNRRLEFSLRHTEWIAALAANNFAAAPGAAITGAQAAAYPHAELLAAWKQVLTHQFHDIIPGSSIRRVYEEAEEVHRKVSADLSALSQKFRREILDKSGAEILAFNDLSWERNDPLHIPALVPAAALKAADGSIHPVQRFKDFDGNEQALCTVTLPSLGWAGFSAAVNTSDAVSENTASPFKYSPGALETPFYKICFDQYGRISSLVDLRRQRELVAGGGSFNAFISAEDVPVYWEAWDIDADWTKYLREETSLISSEVISRGPVCFVLRQTYRIASSSTLIQDMVCYAENPRIDFDTKVDWRERRRLLKVSFDTAIDAAQVRCEVQYGHILRNTHRNLPQDRAKFEICAHKWISLEEPLGGIALLNDCKYGHDVTGGLMRLTLLRSPTAPDPEADAGVHRFTYALLPFAGSFTASGVVRAGYELNDGAAVESSAQQSGGPATAGGAGYSLCRVDGEDVIIECVKAPEPRESINNSAGNSQKLIIRLYESLGGKTETVLHFSRELAAVQETDMLEGSGTVLPFDGKELKLEFKPFEIKTLRVQFS
ncbi:alpha-mannosidase [Spirochaetia bacterium]|nr:alpha-mannosidase [Spirochaetia bacterium]